MRTTPMSRTMTTSRNAATAWGTAAVALVVLTGCSGGTSATPEARTSPSAASTSSGEPTGEPTTPSTHPGPPIEDGYQPPWFEGTGWSCGMSAADLSGVDDEYALTVAGDVTDVVAGEPSHNGDRFLPAELTGPSGRIHVSPPATVWTQDDAVVELPALTDAAPVATAGGKQLDTVLPRLSHCRPADPSAPTPTYGTEMPEGEYQVRAFVEVDPGSSPRRFVLSDPVDVTVTPDGPVQG